MGDEQNSPCPGFVTYVGAGPGDPGLLTINGRNAIAEADLLIYAGSLVSPDIVKLAKADADIHDSACLTLEECHALIKNAALEGQKTARVHTGDPSIYGTLCEQIELLDRDGIPWRIIPGVTAAMAAAAAAGVSFSAPGQSQSLVITRIKGRTPVPERENLASFASHGASMAIYLSGHEAERVQNELSKSLPDDTPVICAYRIGWSDENIVRTTLGKLAECVSAKNMDRQTVFLVLPCHGKKGMRSCLYDGSFAHSFREGKN